MFSAHLHLLHLPTQPCLYSDDLNSPICSASASRSRSTINVPFVGSCFKPRRCSLRRSMTPPIAAMDDDFMDVSLAFDEVDDLSAMDPYYTMYSSGDESDVDVIVNPIDDLELPLSKDQHRHVETPEAALTLTAHRFATIQRGHRTKRTYTGTMINMGLIAFLALFLSFVDWCSWKIVRLPLEPFYLTQPFSISTVMSACAGCLFVPIADSLRIQKMLTKQGPLRQYLRRKVPTMGGLFFVPVGLAVARCIAGLGSIQLSGAALATVAFASIGLIDDIIKINNDHNYRLPGWIKIFFQVVAGACFSFWLRKVDIPNPYKMKFLVPLPPPHGIAYLGKYYLIITTFCFVAMGNGVHLTDRLDGLVGGVSALTFIGMSIAVLPICPDLAIFGASMAGACIGFLFHNRYKASILMGDVGSFALGGALAAMAAISGMFLPLCIASGVFILEMVSVIVQVITKASPRAMPLHYKLKMLGLKTPIIVVSSYLLSSILALFAGYVGLISA